MTFIQGAGMGQVLVLNASYEPLNITTWRRAMVMMLKGKAESLEQDESHEIRRGTHLPTVIRLRQYVRVPFRQVPLTRPQCVLSGQSQLPILRLFRRAAVDRPCDSTESWGPRRLGQHHNGMSELQRP
jgi:hypothetical protein